MNEIKNIKGQAISVPGDDIDTDRIIPARFMKCLTFDGLGKYAFYDVRFDMEGNKKKHPMNDRKFQNHSLLITNSNFGCGSSREHAPWALYGIGIRAIIAESYAEIFAGNCTNLGIPAVIVKHEVCLELQNLAERDPQTDFMIDLEAKKIIAGKQSYDFTLPEAYRQGLLRGQWDSTGLLLESLDLVKEKHGKLPQFEIDSCYPL